MVAWNSSSRGCSARWPVLGPGVDAVTIDGVVATEDESDRLLLLRQVDQQSFGSLVARAYDDGVLRAVPHP